MIRHLAKCSECRWAGLRGLAEFRSEADVLFAMGGLVKLEPCPMCGAGLSPAKDGRDSREAVRQHIGRRIGFPVEVRDHHMDRLLRVVVFRPAYRRNRPVRDGDCYRVKTEEEVEAAIEHEYTDSLLGERTGLLSWLENIVEHFQHDIERAGWVP